jgi:hypothetical protein
MQQQTIATRDMLSETWPSLHATFSTFADELKERLHRGVHTTEDAVRYTLFASLIKNLNLQLYEIILESRHPAGDGRLVDLIVPETSERTGLSLEFKYHRTRKGKVILDAEQRKGTTLATTAHAGALVNDLMRSAFLASAQTRAFVVYLTDSVMDGYWTRHADRYEGTFYAAEDGQWVFIGDEFIESQPATFRHKIPDRYDFSFEVRTVLKASVGHGHVVRIFEIREPVASR